ncbi:2-isopropylmalate synthase [Ascochyta lentis]
MAVDLRDGNQSLPNPMTFAQRVEMFKLLVEIGFKEIEVAFPCSCKTDYDFVRHLVETKGLVPDDVTLQVITPCREDAIETAIESLRGAKKGIVMTYMASSDNLREVMLRLSEDEWVARAKRVTSYARFLIAQDTSGTQWTYNFGFEDFANARPEAVLRCADVVINEWDPSIERPMILGVAASVEVSTPNVFADQIEFFLRNVSRRSDFRLTVHTHNDRGGAVATAELACLAGADRVEGCLFGNGERAGNMDTVVFGLNLLTSGVDPGLDFSNLNAIRKVYEDISKLPVHPRTPYSGDFYFRAFSGAHQDAITKGLKIRNAGSAGDVAGLPTWPAWRVPYLPCDPADVGRSLDCVVGINSQSGKGGVAWMLANGIGLDIPADLAHSFSKIVKAKSDRANRSIGMKELCSDFISAHYMDTLSGIVTIQHRSNGDTQFGTEPLLAILGKSDEKPEIVLAESLSLPVPSVTIQQQKLIGVSIPGRYAAYAKVKSEGWAEAVWGVGIGSGEKESAARAILSAFVAHGELVILSPADVSNASPRTEKETLQTSVRSVPQMLDVHS